jgi:beta-galactosidase/beta-glucuronidase
MAVPHEPGESTTTTGFDESEWPTDDPAYPRRQLQRSTWLNLDGTWRFHFDESASARHPRDIDDWDRSIEVPFAPESRLSGLGDTGFHSDVWYSREFEVHRVDGGRVHLHFGAVDYEARVWVNDVFVGAHEGGHTPFQLDITDVLVEGSQTVTVWAHDDPHNLVNPRGKQDWRLEPHSIWYPRTTGIWQTVWVEALPPAYVDRLTLTPHLERWEIGCEAVIQGGGNGAMQLRVRLTAGDQLLADDRYTIVENEVHRRIALSDPGIDDFRNELLWSPERPCLIRVDVQLLAGDRVVDEVRSYTALRGVALDRGRLLLNNRPYYLRLVLDQGYWPESLMTPPSEEAIIRDIQLVKQAGFNGVRKHQKIEDPRYLYWADKLGLLVWEEMPSAYRFTHESVERITREWMDVIDRDINHPCVIVWVPFNESWGVPNLPSSPAQRNAVQALYHLTRTLDPSRPVIGNDGWESGATDIIGIHDYESDPGRLLARYHIEDGDGIPDLLVNGWPSGRVLTLEDHPHRGQPIMLTEFGGIAFGDPRDDVPPPSWGYSQGVDADDLAARYRGLLAAVHQVSAFAGFCYTQFCDTFQEANGLFYADRTPKLDLEVLRRATEAAPDVPQERQPS